MLINTTTQARIWEHDFRPLFPGTSFPPTMSDADLAPFGYANLNYPAQPIPPAGQKVVDAGSIQLNEQWQVNYQLIPMTTDELAAVAAAELSTFQQSAQIALSATDTTFARIQEAITLGLTTAADPSVIAWIEYRKALRAEVRATVVGTLATKPTNYPAGT